MKQINFIGSENVVNIESPKKNIFFGEYTYDYDGSVLSATTDKKNRFSSKKQRICESF